jgi:cysteine-rich repeat protein
VDRGEECDDGNNLDNDGCSADCTTELPMARCGDGSVDVGEECDDGNNLDNDGCSSRCQRDIQVELDEGQLGCTAIYQCFNTCGQGDRNCVNACIATGAPIGQIRFATVRQCVIDNNCVIDGEVSQECIDTNCVEEQRACLGDGIAPEGDANCAEIIACVEPCNDINCIRTCIFEGSEDGYDEAFALDTCVFNENDCGHRENDCAIDNCGPLITACFGAPVCGNGRREMREACDDGDRNDDNGCSNQCQIQPFCGDGTRDEDERCDDGNNDDGDGCTANCTAERPVPFNEGELACRALNECFLACPENNPDCITACYDVAAPEGQARMVALNQCVLNNGCNGADGIDDACIDANCGPEERACFGNPVFPGGEDACPDVIACAERCRDQDCLRQCIASGTIEGLDEALAVDRCVFDENRCLDRRGECAELNCADVLDACLDRARCGNGILDVDEACDDGNDDETDACLSTCETARCGDGAVQTDIEECDDANAVETDACLSNCRTARCGDGRIHDGVEECDDRNRDETDGCLPTCRNARCGDGVVQVDVEACDDANRDETDGCLGTCAWARGGDGVVQVAVEQCDDGNRDDTDDCLSSCESAQCGDGVLQAGVEQCDDGNRFNNDGCSRRCVTEVPACADDRFEENDNRGTARRMVVGREAGLAICADDEDWYQIQVCPGGTLRVDIRFIDADGDLELTSFEADGTRQDSSSSSTDDESVGFQNNGNMPIIAYVQVQGFLGAANHYDLEITEEGCGVSEEGDVRLAGGQDALRGRVEVFLDGVWGSVCDDSFDLVDARVVCRQLGFAGVESVISNFGGGIDPINMDDVDCTGDEDRLVDCQYLGVGQDNCGHIEDVGIVCSLEDVNGGCVDDRFEENDNLEASVAVNPSAYADLKICADDEDYYQMTVCAGGTLNLQLNFVDADGDLDLELLDDAGGSITVASGVMDVEEIEWVNNLAVEAVVNVRVYGFLGAENDYGLRLGLLDCP